MNKNLTEYPKHKDNPFAANLLIPVRGKTVSISRQAMQIANVDTGEMQEIFMHIKEEVDKEMFVKLFKSQIQAMFSFSHTAYRIFGYLLNATRINEDMIYFDLEDCMKYCGYKSPRSVFNALAELVDKEIIARGNSHAVYHINPAVFFNGNRMIVVKEYLLKSEKAMTDPQQVDMLTGKTNEEMKELMQTNK